jgi:site-specific DNA-methyltransferase (adenine-specific)
LFINLSFSLRSHEDICVFYKKQPTYNPQKTIGEKPNHSKGKPKKTANNNYGEFDFIDNKKVHGNWKFPKSILTFEKPHPSTTINPTQKSIALFEYLIKTYTNENETVLDNVAGSMTTAIACINTNRNFIGIELEPKYVEIANQRIKEAQGLQ